MLFFDSPDPAPNPRRVRIFLAEKGLTLPARTIAITRGEHKGSDYLAINPRGQTPALQLDDGSVLTESVAICRYLDALHPEPPMFGEDARAAGEVEMWSRRAELNLMAAVAQVWIHCHPFTARVNPHRYAEWGEVNRDRAVAVMAMFDEQLAGRQWLATDRYTMADILLLTTIDFAQFVGIERPAALTNLAAWHERASARPSAAA